jgi:hypothetical protein
MEKEEIINLIKGRIEDEQRKHPLLDWSRIAAAKIYTQWFEYFNNENKDLSLEEYWMHQEKSAKAFIQGYTQCQEDMADNSKVTRFEVIDENGRVYTKHNCTIELSYQDDNRTLKVFINSLNKQD